MIVSDVPSGKSSWAMRRNQLTCVAKAARRYESVVWLGCMVQLLYLRCKDKKTLQNRHDDTEGFKRKAVSLTLHIAVH